MKRRDAIMSYGKNGERTLSWNGLSITDPHYTVSEEQMYAQLEIMIIELESTDEE
jgi:hypothetical protein